MAEPLPGPTPGSSGESSRAGAAGAPPEDAPLNQLAGLYSSPRAAFTSILARPRFLFPLLGLVILNALFTVFWMRKVDPVEFVKTQMEESGRADRIPAEKRAEVMEQQAKLFKVFGWVGALAGAPLLVLIVGAIYLFVFRFVLGGEVSFAQAMTVVAWSFLVTALVSTPLTFLTLSLKGDWNINPQEALQTNLSFFLDREATPKPLFALAGSLDVLSFWVLFLLSVGFGVASRRGTSSAARGVVGIWAVYVLGRMGLAAVF
jgi:hypothetical protein